IEPLRLFAVDAERHPGRLRSRLLTVCLRAQDVFAVAWELDGREDVAFARQGTRAAVQRVARRGSVECCRVKALRGGPWPRVGDDSLIENSIRGRQILFQQYRRKRE